MYQVEALHGIGAEYDIAKADDLLDATPLNLASTAGV